MCGSISWNGNNRLTQTLFATTLMDIILSQIPIVIMTFSSFAISHLHLSSHHHHRHSMRHWIIKLDSGEIYSFCSLQLLAIIDFNYFLVGRTATDWHLCRHLDCCCSQFAAHFMRDHFASLHGLFQSTNYWDRWSADAVR
jgi:hypothetical protein